MTHIFKPYDPVGPTWRWRRRLPHWEQPGCTYFVTFRTADSLPQSLVRELKLERDIWLRQHPPPWGPGLRQEFSQRFLETVEVYLDSGYGACDLALPEASGFVEAALRHFDGSRYLLDRFVVMPNHVHCLVLPFEGMSLKETTKSWKSFSGRRINALKGVQGQFWMEESFDRIVRSADKLNYYRAYIRYNPVRAGLAGTHRFRLGCGLGIDSGEAKNRDS
jgi:REP element-mobilizing transposase RayT